MNLIKISTDLELSVHEFPTGTHEEQNNKLRELIGNDCRLHQMDHPTKVKGQCVSMLIDEEGLLKEVIIPNLIGSYLYETDKHNIPITGNILIVGEEWTGDGIDFCSIEESVFKVLELQLNNMIMAMKATMEVLK